MKYREMKESLIKISYNSMGEPVKKRINFGKTRVQKPQNICSLPSVSRSVHNNDTSIKTLTETPLEAIRTIHVLRDVLLGKVFRDVISSQDTTSLSLSEVLRFFCQTSFGATSVAKERQMDLFHAILVHQQSSSFLRVMKRLLLIPGIKSYDENASAIYFEAWCWLIQNDMVVNLDNDTSIEVPIENMFGCLEYVWSANGNSFSPQLRYDIEQIILSHGKNWAGESSTNKYRYLKPGDPSNALSDQKEISTVHVDNVLECILETLEKHDKYAAQFAEEIFSTHQRVGITVLNSECTTSDIYKDLASFGTESDSKSILDIVKVLLSDLVAHDIERGGSIKKDHFASILKDWYHSFGVANLDLNILERLLLRFEIDGCKGTIDYVAFFGVLYTFALEEAPEIPLPDKLACYADNYRGTEQDHLICVQNYVQWARLKVDDLDATENPVSMRERVVKSRRSICKIRPLSSDFLSKWVVATSSMTEVPLGPIHNGSQTTSDRRPSGSSTKTKLHVTEPQLNIPIANEFNTLYNDDSKNDSLEEERNFATNKKIGERIYVRFPDVEPVRQPLRILEKTIHSNIDREKTYRPNSSSNYRHGCVITTGKHAAKDEIQKDKIPYEKSILFPIIPSVASQCIPQVQLRNVSKDVSDVPRSSNPHHYNRPSTKGNSIDGSIRKPNSKGVVSLPLTSQGACEALNVERIVQEDAGKRFKSCAESIPVYADAGLNDFCGLENKWDSFDSKSKQLEEKRNGKEDLMTDSRGHSVIGGHPQANRITPILKLRASAPKGKIDKCCNDATVEHWRAEEKMPVLIEQIDESGIKKLYEPSESQENLREIDATLKASTKEPFIRNEHNSRIGDATLKVSTKEPFIRNEHNSKIGEDINCIDIKSRLPNGPALPILEENESSLNTYRKVSAKGTFIRNEPNSRIGQGINCMAIKSRLPFGPARPILDENELSLDTYTLKRIMHIPRYVFSAIQGDPQLPKFMNITRDQLCWLWNALRGSRGHSCVIRSESALLAHPQGQALDRCNNCSRSIEEKYQSEEDWSEEGEIDQTIINDDSNLKRNHYPPQLSNKTKYRVTSSHLQEKVAYEAYSTDKSSIYYDNRQFQELYSDKSDNGLIRDTGMNISDEHIAIDIGRLNFMKQYDWESIFSHTETELLNIVSGILRVEEKELIAFLEKHIHGESVLQYRLRKNSSLFGTNIYKPDTTGLLVCSTGKAKNAVNCRKRKSYSGFPRLHPISYRIR